MGKTENDLSNLPKFVTHFQGVKTFSCVKRKSFFCKKSPNLLARQNNFSNPKCVLQSWFFNSKDLYQRHFKRRNININGRSLLRNTVKKIDISKICKICKITKSYLVIQGKTIVAITFQNLINSNKSQHLVILSGF